MCYCWREASKCTIGQNSIENEITNNNDKQSSEIFYSPSLSSSTSAQLLNLDCGRDLIFIASSHYGHKTDEKYLKKKEILLKNNLYFNKRNDSFQDGYV